VPTQHLQNSRVGRRAVRTGSWPWFLASVWLCVLALSPAGVEREHTRGPDPPSGLDREERGPWTTRRLAFSCRIWTWFIVLGVVAAPVTLAVLPR